MQKAFLSPAIHTVQNYINQHRFGQIVPLLALRVKRLSSTRPLYYFGIVSIA
jgi:hypothetical protein